MITNHRADQTDRYTCSHVEYICIAESVELKIKLFLFGVVSKTSTLVAGDCYTSHEPNTLALKVTQVSILSLFFSNNSLVRLREIAMASF